MILYHKAICNIFGFGIYHKLHYILKSKSYQNRNIGLFSGNDTTTTGYFIGMHIYFLTKKVLLTTIYLSGYSSISLNSNIFQVVYYITDILFWQGCYILLKTLFPCLRVRRLVDSDIAGMEKLYDYS